MATIEAGASGHMPDPADHALAFAPEFLRRTGRLTAAQASGLSLALNPGHRSDGIATWALPGRAGTLMFVLRDKVDKATDRIRDAHGATRGELLVFASEDALGKANVSKALRTYADAHYSLHVLLVGDHVAIPRHRVAYRLQPDRRYKRVRLMAHDGDPAPAAGASNDDPEDFAEFLRLFTPGGAEGLGQIYAGDAGAAWAGARAGDIIRIEYPSASGGYGVEWRRTVPGFIP